eukprot:1159122-Pelagomonas_calceolata.AAC.11
MQKAVERGEIEQERMQKGTVFCLLSNPFLPSVHIGMKAEERPLISKNVRYSARGTRQRRLRA